MASTMRERMARAIYETLCLDCAWKNAYPIQKELIYAAADAALAAMYDPPECVMDGMYQWQRDPHAFLRRAWEAGLDAARNEEASGDSSS